MMEMQPILRWKKIKPSISLVEYERWPGKNSSHPHSPDIYGGLFIYRPKWWPPKC